jgi:pyrroline-5-carboxylate reductase
MNILFIGCGKMGSAILKNLVDQKSFKTSQISVLKPTSKNQIKEVKYYKKLKQLTEKKYQADIVFIAVKPQNSQEILNEIIDSDKKIFSEKTIFISILAGKKISFFEKILTSKAKIIRSMPNMAISNSKGIFLYQKNKNINKAEEKLLNAIFNKFGFSYQIKDEKLFDSLTAIFGSGPAYLFLFQEIICEITKSFGIEEQQAILLTKYLFLGTSLTSFNSDLSFTLLKDSITSKEGTTSAGLSIFENKDSLKKLVKKAISKAEKRSKQLSK